MDILSEPLVNAEFVALDTETNGLSGDSCELTEVGAVLVGGGELHDRFESLVRTNMPLGRGIQRFTGITQTMIDTAPDNGSRSDASPLATCFSRASARKT